MRLSILLVLQGAILASVGLVSPSELGRHDAGLPVARASAQEDSASDCLGFEKQDAGKGVDYALKNACEKKLACTVTWKLACENDKGVTTSSSAKSERFALSGSDEHVVHASAESCKQGWRIDDVSWSCSGN